MPRTFLSHLVLSCVLTFSLFASVADALPVKKLKITPGKRSDKLLLTLPVPGDVLASNKILKVRVDGTVVDLDTAAFKSKRRNNQISVFSQPKRRAGITRATVDQKKGTLTIRGNKLNLRDVPSTFEVELFTDSFKSC